MRKCFFYSVITLLLCWKPAPALAGDVPASQAALPANAAAPLNPFFDELEERTFRYFWETGNPVNGLVPDRHPSRSASSIAAVGFALTAYPIGIERGYINREEGRRRTLTTLQFFHRAPQGPQEQGITGYKGFFYHFLDMKTGLRAGNSELSTIDTALFLAGALFSQAYFNGSHPDEAAIRELAEKIYRRIDWQWAQNPSGAVTMGWFPDRGPLKREWTGYNEAMLLYIFALASPTHPLGPNAWHLWVKGYEGDWGKFHGWEFLRFGPLFGHQYSHVWLDFRGIQDAYMRGRGIDYFENSRRATYAQRAYAIANPGKWKGYGENIWGLTACDGPANTRLEYGGGIRQFHTYFARGAGGDHSYDDGTLAPTAAIASIAFAPEIAIPAVLEMHKRYGEHIYSGYGFLDAFNPSFEYDTPLGHGRVIKGFGWVDKDYVGIDQGPILTMLENYRSDFVWRVMRNSPHVRTGLIRAGFRGGWLERQPRFTH